MNIVFINGSPKTGKSCSEYLLETIKKNISPDKNIYEISIADKKIKDDDKFHIIANCNKILIACPLYVDCLPSTVIKFLEGYEEYINKNKITKVSKFYGVVNSGFFEGSQNRQALRVFRNFTSHIEKLKYGGGIGIGGGPFIGDSEGIPWKSKIKASVKENLDIFTDAINNGDIINKDIFINVNMNKRLYKASGDLSWIISGFKNKVYPGRLNNKPYKK